MKAKRKGPRYTVLDRAAWYEWAKLYSSGPEFRPVMDRSHPDVHEAIESDKIARLLNAGERAKAEVKRLRVEADEIADNWQKMFRNVCRQRDELKAANTHLRQVAGTFCDCEVCR